MKQTAVEWLLDQLENQVSDDGKQTMSLKVTGFLREQAKEMEKQQIIEHSVELAKLLFSNPIEKSGKTPEELVNSYFKNKEEPIQEILENLENQLKKVIKEHPIDVNEDNYWRGVKIGLETAVEVIKFKVW
jgi:hypothetical protein